MDTAGDVLLQQEGAAAPVVMPIPFGVVISGRPLLTDFRPIESSKAITEIFSPGEVTDLVFFLLPNSPVPPGMAAVLYYSVPPYNNWEILGAITLNKPSGVFRTGWQEHEAVATAPVIQLGISLESEEMVQNLGIGETGWQERKQFALKVAQDLFNFMTSFSQSVPGRSEVMTVPTNVLDRWMERFNAKYARDPNFMMK